MGYYGFFLGMQYRNDLTMSRVLDAGAYNDATAFTIKIPLSVPYVAGNDGFERVDGKFEHKGEHYRLVKQKYANDTLTVVCVKDFENKRISQELSNYVKNFSDQGAEHSEQSKINITFIKDYLPQFCAMRTLTAGWEIDLVHHDFARNLIAAFEVSVVHPPERA